MNKEKTISLRPFPELGPETVLNLVEAELDIPCSNLCRQLNSYINRVFELETLGQARVDCQVLQTRSLVIRGLAG